MALKYPFTQHEASPRTCADALVVPVTLVESPHLSSHALGDIATHL